MTRPKIQLVPGILQLLLKAHFLAWLQRTLDGFGRHWTARHDVRKAYRYCILDGLDGLDGFSFFRRKGVL
jgi:hypothetical protein